MFRAGALALMLALPVAQASAQPKPKPKPTATAQAPDPFLWLEEVESPRALAWVRDQNAKSLAVLKGDPRYEPFRRQALDILTATDRIPSPTFRAGGIDNFWQDRANPRGVWRRTTLDSYRTAAPRWETVLDIDALGRAEGRPWVFKGDQCLEPDERLCLVSLSNGGKDAVVVREFDTVTKRFVPNGFTLPEGKHRFDWLDRDTLIVATDFGPGTLTESGYPYIVKLLKRGQTLAQAREVFRGSAKDGGYGVLPEVMRDSSGELKGVLIARPTSTFEGEHYWLADSAAKPFRLAMPLRSTSHGYFHDKLVFTVEQDWTGLAERFRSGSLVAFHPEELRATPTQVSNAARLVFEPSARQSINEVAITRDRIVVAVYDEVRGRLMSFEDHGEWGWPAKQMPLAENASVTLVDTTKSSNDAFVRVEGFLTPATLMLADATTGQVEQVKASPARFNAADAVVEQFQATSRDGTKIPYFVVRPKSLRSGGSPALLFGYGGFQVSKPPVYIPEMGKLWLENGGVFVNANIRGGGEFGPAWHQSVLRENRQGAFNDFAAVAEDLIRRGITSPDRLGIYGRSNGGVLTSVTLTQHPELIDAAVIESPLIDMLRYHELPAGASWMGEYGDPRVPADRAFIARYSAYQNLKPGQRYPEPYITTNTRDDRVHPGHARKFAAKLQAMGYPALYYENTEGGHSNDADPLMNAERWARHYVYLARKLMDDAPAVAADGQSPTLSAPVAAAVVRFKAAVAAERARQAALPPPTTLAERLSRRVDLEQAARRVVFGTPLTQGDRTSFFDTVGPDLNAIDADNLAFVKSVLPSDGWFRNSRDGKQVGTDAWLIVQHAWDAPFQKQVLSAMLPLVEAGEASGPDYALLYDRIEVEEGRPQRFGSQSFCNAGTVAFHPIEAPARIDERRKAVGLNQPHAEYARSVRIGAAC